MMGKSCGWGARPYLKNKWFGGKKNICNFELISCVLKILISMRCDLLSVFCTNLFKSFLVIKFVKK